MKVQCSRRVVFSRSRCVLIPVSHPEFSSRGVTLIELLVVLVVLSIGLSLVIPSLGNTYEGWVLRTESRKAVAFFRAASDTARREGSDVTGYYDGQRLVLQRNGSIYKTMEIAQSILILPEKPGGAVFLSTGQIVTSQPFLLENRRGKKASITFGPLPGQVALKEGAE